MKKRLIILFFLVLCGNPAVADYPLEIIDLKTRPADEILPLIKPFVGDDGIVTGKDYKLIIRAAPERLQDIRNILNELDQRPRRLMVHVRRIHPDELERQHIGYGANLSVGDKARIAVGKPAPRHGVSIHANSIHTRRENQLTQKVQALEGQPAFISVGRSIPTQNWRIGPFGYQSTTYYRDAETGFYVVPRIKGSLVTLEISQQHETPSHRYSQTDTQIDSQQLHTTVTGRLGAWITVGGADTSASEKRSGVGIHERTYKESEWVVQLMVETIP